MDFGKKKLKVIIVGGGIGGLALANALQRSSIDFVLLERGSSLDPQVGASIGLLPNSSRLLDQLDCYEEILSTTEPVRTQANHRADGTLIGEVSDTLELLEKRFVATRNACSEVLLIAKYRTGYPVLFLDRQWLLGILGKRIKFPDKVLLNQTVASIESRPDKAVVHCDDGTDIEGDIVVGADGVYSTVRREMWRHAELQGLEDRFAADKKALSAEYKCLFGISTRIEGMSIGETDKTFSKDLSTMSYVGKEGRVYWFVFVRMDKVYYPPDIPRFTSKDTDDLVSEFGHLPIRDNVTLDDFYRTRTTSRLVSIEEAEYQNWTLGRLVCVGDSIHKMTPNLGAGAASAMEDVSVLSSVLVKAVQSGSDFSLPKLESNLQQYEQIRKPRITRILKVANNLTRLQALRGRKEYIIQHYVAPRRDEFLGEMFSSFLIGAPRFEFLPVPKRSVSGTMPFNPKQGWGYEESQKTRMGTAFLLLCLSGVGLLHSYVIDQPQNVFKKKQLFALSLHSSILYGIWLLESSRLNNKGSLLQFPLLFGLIGQQFGMHIAAPLYFFFHYVSTPISNFRASDNRLMDVSYIYAVAPLVVFLDILPRLLLLFPFNARATSVSELLQRFYPISITVAQFVLSKLLFRRTVRKDRLNSVRKDVIPLQVTLLFFVLLSSMSWIFAFGRSDFAAFASLSNPTSGKGSLSMLSRFSDPSTDLLCTTVVVWTFLVSTDLRNAGMIEQGTFSVLAGSVLSVIALGPATTLALAWWARERILLDKRHKHAVTTAGLSD